MGLREYFNKYPKVAYGICSAVVVVSVGMIVQQVMASRHRFPTDLPRSYYTIDDGKTFFAGSGSEFPPFEYEGKQAMRAHVFKGSNGTQFVGFLERYSEETKKLLASGKSLTPEMARFGRELKRPGDNLWAKSGDMIKDAKVTDITKSPDGSVVIEELDP